MTAAHRPVIGVTGQRSQAGSVGVPARFHDAVVGGALQTGTPMLGICRGAQLLNVALGGTLVADLPIGTSESHASYAYPRSARTHAATFTSTRPPTASSGAPSS